MIIIWVALSYSPLQHTQVSPTLHVYKHLYHERHEEHQEKPQPSNIYSPNFLAIYKYPHTAATKRAPTLMFNNAIIHPGGLARNPM